MNGIWRERNNREGAKIVGEAMQKMLKLGILCLIFFLSSGLSVGQRNERAETGADLDPGAGFQCPGKITKQPRPATKMNLGELTKKALRLPQPRYPQLAKASRVYGTVKAEVVIDVNTGAVVWAQVTSGDPLLKPAVSDVVCRARFAGTYDVDGYVSGMLTYTFRHRR